MITGIILAAGESKRMRESRGVDTAKQLLSWKNTTMLQQVIDNATASELSAIIVVLGYDASNISSRLKTATRVRIMFNPDFKAGMSSSLKCGIRNIPASATAFMILLGDQPLIGPEIIDKLIDSYSAGKHGIVVPVHSGHRGHPIIFDCRYRDELLSISDQIAKEVTRAHSKDILEVTVESPNIFVDIDTYKDYQEARTHIDSAEGP